MMLRPRRRIRRSLRGGYELRLPDEERELLRSLPDRLKDALTGIAQSSEVPEQLRRLFPPAYLQDDDAENAYRYLTRTELLEHHIEALSVLERTASAMRLSEEEADAWLAALNDLRLSIGTQLGMTEELREIDERDPRYPDWICYQYLSFLQNEAIEALSGSLPPPSPGADELLPDDPWGDPPGGLRWDGTPQPDT